MTRVLVAAASAVTRAGLEAILAREPGFSVVGDGSAPSSLADDVAESEPGIVLIELPDALGSDSLATLRVLGVDADETGRLGPAVVVLTDDDDPTRLGELIDAGARVVLPRNAPAAEIVAGVAAAAAGLVAFPSEWLRGSNVAREIWSADRAPGAPRAGENGAHALTGRELEVLRMLAEGLANKQIGARLGISEHTVKFHVGSVFTKLAASTRAEAVMIGARKGLIVL